MAVSQVHFRSISLPSRLHPINPTEFESELQTLNSSLSRTAPITSETIQSALVSLAELYNSIEELTQSSSTQQSLHNHNEKSVEDSLENSVHLLDSCSSIRESVQMMKENVQTLQSALRRKGFDSSIQNDIASYLCFRKKMNKCIAKSLKTLKNLENKKGSNLSVSGDGSSISVLMEVSETTIAIFKWILLLFSSPAVKSGGWNLVSKLMLNKSAGSKKDEDVVISEVGCVDLALNDVHRSGRSSELKVIDRQIVQKSLQNLESCLEGIEEGLEKLFRKLLHCRVVFLNSVADH